MKIRGIIELTPEQALELKNSLDAGVPVKLELDIDVNKERFMVIPKEDSGIKTPQDVSNKLQEIANRSLCYEDFVEKVLDWLDLGEQREYFKAVIYCAEKSVAITWEGIERVMLGQRNWFTATDRAYTARKINKKTKNVVNSRVFIKSIIQYAKYKFI